MARRRPSRRRPRQQGYLGRRRRHILSECLCQNCCLNSLLLGSFPVAFCVSASMRGYSSASDFLLIFPLLVPFSAPPPLLRKLFDEEGWVGRGRTNKTKTRGGQQQPGTKPETMMTKTNNRDILSTLHHAASHSIASHRIASNNIA